MVSLLYSHLPWYETIGFSLYCLFLGSLRVVISTTGNFWSFLLISAASAGCSTCHKIRLNCIPVGFYGRFCFFKASLTEKTYFLSNLPVFRTVLNTFSDQNWLKMAFFAFFSKTASIFGRELPNSPNNI